MTKPPTGPAPRNQTSVTSIPESVTKLLQSLVELQQKVALQSSAWHNVKSRALASSSLSRPLLEEIETHHIGMETTLAILIAFRCGGSSVAARTRDELKSKLRSNIEDIKHLRDTLTNASISALSVTRKVISIDRPGKAIARKDTIHHTDIDSRPAFYPQLAEFRLVLTAKFIPSACSGLSGPCAPAFK